MEPLPDSATYIANLERKLGRLKQKNESKVTGKTLIASMSEFKEIYMRDAFKNNFNLNADSEENNNNETVDISYLQRKIDPVQQINVEETKCLIENDWLSKNDENIQDEKQNESDRNVIVMNPL